MLEKLLGLGLAAALVVTTTLGWQLDTARKGLSEATSALTVSRTAEANAKQAQESAEKQNAFLAASFAALDGRLRTLADDQKKNALKLEDQLKGIETLQKTEGDSDASFLCLDLDVPQQLDQRLRQ